MTFEVIPHIMNDLSLHNVSMHKNFHTNQFEICLKDFSIKVVLLDIGGHTSFYDVGFHIKFL